MEKIGYFFYSLFIFFALGSEINFYLISIFLCLLVVILLIRKFFLIKNKKIRLKYSSVITSFFCFLLFGSIFITYDLLGNDFFELHFAIGILFYFILFYFILPYFILFYFIRQKKVFINYILQPFLFFY